MVRSSTHGMGVALDARARGQDHKRSRHARAHTPCTRTRTHARGRGGGQSFRCFEEEKHANHACKARGHNLACSSADYDASLARLVSGALNPRRQSGL